MKLGKWECDCGWFTVKETYCSGILCPKCNKVCSHVGDAKTLDAGSGIGPKRPAPGFSAYCDVIVPKPGDIVPENYHVAPLEDLSCFKDKEFDYIRAHHCLEHCNDPNKACAELIRVGKSGLISYPPMWSCLLFGRADHRYFMTEDHGRLVFIRKRHPSYGVPRRIVGTELNRDFKWEGSFKWLVVE